MISENYLTGATHQDLPFSGVLASLLYCPYAETSS